MLAMRRSREGVLPIAELRRRSEAIALVGRERLVFGPALGELLVFLGGALLGHALVVLARLGALLGGERRPALHAPLHPLLLLRLHRRVALGEPHPLAASLGGEVWP